jgi:hypothetical protein
MEGNVLFFQNRICRWRSMAPRERPNRCRLCSRISSAVPSGSYSCGSAKMRSRPMLRRSHAVYGRYLLGSGIH